MASASRRLKVSRSSIMGKSGFGMPRLEPQRDPSRTGLALHRPRLWTHGANHAPCRHADGGRDGRDRGPGPPPLCCRPCSPRAQRAAPAQPGPDRRRPAAVRTSGTATRADGGGWPAAAAPGGQQPAGDHPRRGRAGAGVGQERGRPLAVGRGLRSGVGGQDQGRPVPLVQVGQQGRVPGQVHVEFALEGARAVRGHLGLWEDRLAGADVPDDQGQGGVRLQAVAGDVDVVADGAVHLEGLGAGPGVAQSSRSAARPSDSRRRRIRPQAMWAMCAVVGESGQAKHGGA